MRTIVKKVKGPLGKIHPMDQVASPEVVVVVGCAVPEFATLGLVPGSLISLKWIRLKVSSQLNFWACLKTS